MCLSPNDDVLASGTQKGHIQIWSMQDSHELVGTLETGNKMVLSTAFNIDAKLVSASIDGYVNLFDVSTQTVLHNFRAHALPIRSVCFSPGGKVIYTASDDAHVAVHDVNSGKLIQQFSHKGMAFSVDASQDHRHFAVGCADGSTHIWDLGRRRKVQTFEQHNNQCWNAQYNKYDMNNKQMFASVGQDALLQVYE